MNIIITDELRQQCLLPFGISEADVAFVAEHPEQSEAISMGGSNQTTALFAGWPSSTPREFPILLSGKLSGEDYAVNMAFKIPADIAGTELVASPLEMLRGLAERFGLYVGIGDRMAKFLVSERIKVASYESITMPIVQNPNNISFLLLYTVRPIVEGERKYADCNLCFALEVDRYRQAIGQLPRQPPPIANPPIELRFEPNAQELMTQLRVPPGRAVLAVRDRHPGMLLQNPQGAPRAYGMHWFDDGQIVYVQGDITQMHRDAHRAQIGTVTADLVLALREHLPAGRLEPSLKMERALALIAGSFGLPVRCHQLLNAAKLQSGPWNGLQPVVYGAPGEPYLLSGAFDPLVGRCECVWAFSPNTYLKWWESPPKSGRGLL